MVPRYARKELMALWSPETTYRTWFEIEAHAATAFAKLGVIPKNVPRVLWRKGKRLRFDAAEIQRIERTVKHDVIAFLTYLAEKIGPEARFVHQGMTSSDVLDTCLSVQLARAADILLDDIDRVLDVLKKRALQYRYTLCVGRSHGVHAEPTTFGLKLAGHYAEFVRARKRLVAARTEVAVCAISGAVGTYAHIDPRVEAHVAKKLGLTPETISTQVIPRDRHAAYVLALAQVAGATERLATEIRHLARTEVREVEEAFAKGQKGSSAMPHKRNPVLSENICGLARMVRGYVVPALENVALWHERDISHSSVERFMMPDATTTLDFALVRLAGIVKGLKVYPKQMEKNLGLMRGLVYSQRVLLALTQAGVTREEAYRLVQENAMRVWAEEADFLSLLKADPRVSKYLSPKVLASLFSPAYHTKYVDTLYRRVFAKR